jgi:uncharacterized protein
MGKQSNDQPASSTSGGSEAPTKLSGFSLAQEPVIGIEPEIAKYEVAPEPAPAPAAASLPAFEDLGELPKSYGWDSLYLTARDPRWLFAYWDFDWLRIPGGAFQYGVRMYFLRVSRLTGAVEATIEIQPEARNWYVPVSAPATGYFAEIGYMNTEGTFVTCVRSAEAWTPPDSLAEEPAEPQFTTAPAALSFEDILGLIHNAMEDGESLLSAVARVTHEGTIAFRAGKPPTWSDEQRRILAALLGHAIVDSMGLGSAELDELLRKTLLERLHSESASGFSSVWQRALDQPGAESSLFSGVTSWGWGASWSAQPFSVRAERGFFMHVNAEIIFYGGTHPDAAVWIDSKRIALNPDGTFRYHFRLPDGDWNIPIVAQSPDKVEQRSATLSFHRATVKTGGVSDTAQPQELPAEPMGRK